MGLIHGFQFKSLIKSEVFYLIFILVDRNKCLQKLAIGFLVLSWLLGFLLIIEYFFIKIDQKQEKNIETIQAQVNVIYNKRRTACQNKQKQQRDIKIYQRIKNLISNNQLKNIKVHRKSKKQKQKKESGNKEEKRNQKICYINCLIKIGIYNDIQFCWLQFDYIFEIIEQRFLMDNKDKQVPKQLWEIYNVNDFIDAKDNQGDWRVGYIVEKNINNKMYKVRFDGWGSKYDESYRFTSPKLFHFRSVVVGYTGQKKNPGLRADWKFTLKTHEQKLAQFNQFCKSQDKNAWEINQFFRGHNYLYTDFLMTETFTTPQQITGVMQYFLGNVKLVIGYLKSIDPQFKKYYRSQQIPEESHLVDAQSAKANCFFELMDTLYIISGSYVRLESFFSKNAALLRKYLNVDFEKNVRRYYQLRILEEVMAEEGSTVLQQLIEVKLQNSKCIIPFLFLKSLSALYIGLSNQVQYKQKKKYLDLLVEITKKNLLKLDQKSLKDINKAHVVELFETLKGVYQNTDDEQTIKAWALSEEVKLYQKMVTCPYFDKKLKGVIGFQELTEKNKMQPYANNFIQVLLSHKIFDSLFSSDNAQIIRKAAEFCKTLCFHEMFPPEVAFRIWELREGKHEAALQQIYSLMASLPSKYNRSEFQKELFKVISKQPKQEWDEDYIKMIKQYSLTAVDFTNSDKKQPQKYGYDILYTNAIIKKTDFAIASFIQLLSRFEKTDVMTQFIDSCFKKIQNQQDSFIYVILLLKVIQDNLSQFKQLPVNISSTIINDLLKNSNDSLQRNIKRFELLSQITKQTNVNIAFEQFMAMWNEFKNKPSQRAFHEWILNKKDGERISLNIRIGTDVRRSIFEQIWKQQYNYTEISEKQAQIFIQFFKATNTYEGKIKKLNAIIKTEDLNLIGMEKIWRGFETAQNQKIASNLSQLIVQIHMCPTKSQEEQKQPWTIMLINEFSKKIIEAYKQKNLPLVKRLLLIPYKIMERDEQIFPTKSVKNYIMRQYKVINKSTKEQKFIKFNFGGLTYQFKKIVAEKFKVPLKRCRISCKGQLIKYENYFKSMAECSFSNAPFEIEVLEEEVPSIKKCLNSQLQTFFNLLGDPELERNVWQIIERLPIAEDELKKLQNSAHPWEQINNPSIYKQLYIMRVMGFMNSSWWAEFSSGPGLLNLSKKFGRVTAKAKVQRQYMKVLCESIEMCLDIKASLKQINLQNFVLNLLHSLEELLENTADQSQGKRNSVQVSIVTSIFNISKKISESTNFLKVMIEQFPDKIKLLEKGLVTVKNQFIRKQFISKLKQVSRNINPENVQVYLNIIYKDIFNFATSYPNAEQTTQYFQYASDLVDIIQPEQFTKFLKQSDNQLIKLVQRGLYLQKYEQSAETCNYQLVGYLLLMKKLIIYCSTQQKIRMTQFLIYKCFFPHLDNQNAEVLCKCKQSKTAGFDLLASLLRQNKNSLKAIEILSNLHKTALWRTKKNDDWTLTPGEKIKSASGYVGLKNLGCICYMNSLFQQIFMIPDFRQAILQCEDPFQQKEIPAQNLLYQVKKMFYSLLFSDTKYYMPNQFCHAFKNYQGQPTNVYEQMDIDEFSNILFDRLQNQIKNTASEKIIKDFFGGVFSNEIICKGCPHFSQTEQSFLSISLNVKTKKNIYQSFDAMIKGDTLDGDNAYFCQRCNKKVPAVKRVCLKTLPDHLILTLKRFEFDFETMNKIKLNDYCQFPTELNVKQYSQQYLRKQENPDRFDEQQMLPDSYYDYTLQGVVIHIGHADSGHYFSYIKERKNQGRWFQFNDTIVRPFDIRKLAEQAFGGQMGTIQVKQKIKNAYMLIYERKKKIIDHSKLINHERNLAEIPIYANLRQQIKKANVIQKIQSILFSTEYTKFAGNLLKYIQKMEEETAIFALKYVVQVYLTVIIRQKQELPSFQFLKSLHKTLSNYPNVKDWILQIFTAQKSLNEFFKNNPAKEVKKLLAHWISDIAKDSREQIQNKFIDGLLAYMIINNDNAAQFCQILYEMMAKDSVCDYVSKRHVAGILIENINNKEKGVFKNIQEYSVVESAQELIGKQIIIEKSPHELTKKIKNFQDTPFVWGIIARLVQFAQKQDKKLSQILIKQEMDLVYFPIVKIYKILEQCKSKFMINKFCKLLTHLAKDNQKFTEEVLSLGYQGLKQFQSKRYRQFFILLNKFSKIKDNDPLQELRKKKALQYMIRALKQNERYTLDSNIIQQWILKTIRKNKGLQQLLVSSQDYIKYLTELTSKKQPTEDVCRKNTIFQETSVNKYHGIKMLKSKKGYEQLAKKIQKFYVDLLSQKPVATNQWDSDDDIDELDLKPGDTIAYFDNKDKIQFLQARVQDVLLARLTLVVNKTKIPSLWKDDEKLTSGKYPFEEVESDDEIVDSENTTEMQYDQDLPPAI